jgi:peroxiredoxin
VLATQYEPVGHVTQVPDVPSNPAAQFTGGIHMRVKKRKLGSKMITLIYNTSIDHGSVRQQQQQADQQHGRN